MQLAQPQYLLLLWVIPALVVFYLWAFRRRQELLRLFARHEQLARLLPPDHGQQTRRRATLLSTGVVFVLLALLRPQWGFQWEELTRRGVDILVAVDVSQSMRAQDVKPDRLERAKRELTDLLGKLQGDRVGLIAFAGTAFVQCPLTLDYGAFAMFLDQISPSLIPVPGTSISSAIRLARQSFLEASSASRALILITDGEDHEGDPLEAAREAKEAGIQIYSIGIGVEEGAPIPSPDGSGFIKDDAGELVMTRLDEATLQRIAVETGGATVRSTTGDLDLDRIYFEGIKSSLEDAELKSSRQKHWEERFQWPLAVAVGVFLLEPLLSTRRRRRRDEERASSGPAQSFSRKLLLLPLLLAVTGVTQETRAELLGDGTIREGMAAYEQGDIETALQKFTDAKIDHPQDPLLDYNLGNAYYKARRFDEAEASYQRVISRSPDPRLRARSWYNLGNTAFRQGKLEQAVEHYQEALKLDPGDEDARKNLERTREEIRRRLEQQKERQQRQQQQNPSSAEEDQPQGDQGSGGQADAQQGQGGDQPPQAGQEGQDPQEQPGQGDQGQNAQDQNAQDQNANGQNAQDQNAQDQNAQDQNAQGQNAQGQNANGQNANGQNAQRAGSQGQKGKDPVAQQPGADPAQQDAPSAAARTGETGQEDADTPGQDQAGSGAGAAESDQTGADDQKPGSLSREEALRLLHQVQDAQPAGMRGQSRRSTGGVTSAPGGKPW